MAEKKYVLLVGVEFNNQGAYLMLQAAAEMIRREFDGIPVVEFHNGSEEKKRLAGVYPLVPQRTIGLFLRLRRFPLLSRIWPRFPLILPSQISAVFDGSGFLYGDQWAHRNLAYTASKLQDWATRGVPVYMLPQAFGPFTKTAEPSRVAVQSARIVFARDPESEAFVRELLPVSSKTALRRRPDFTAGLVGTFPRDCEAYRGRVPIIANTNIYDRAGSAEKQALYLTNLSTMAEYLEGEGLRPYLLAHEGRKDVELLTRVAATVRKRTGLELPIVQGLNGLQLKGLIGTAPLIISGRYHAIVSALSQGVPAVIHGWSHKYEHVADDFAARELLCDPLGDTDRGVDVLRYILAHDELPALISAASDDVRRSVTEMWDEIRADLASAGKG